MSHDAARIADDIVTGQAGYRRRARWAVVTAVFVAAAVVAVVVPVGLQGRTTAGVPVSAREAVSDEARIYAAVLGGEHLGHSTGNKVYLDDEFCTGMINIDKRGPCDAGPIPADIRAGLSELMGPDLVIGGTRPKAKYSGPAVQFLAVQLGRARVSADTAYVPVDEFCGPLCGMGYTAVLTRTATGWDVTGQTDHAWIS